MDKELSMDQAFIKQLDGIIETHLEDEQFGVEELAKELGLSRSQLHRKLNSITGKSSSQYIREYRLEKAMEMLKNDVATASEIAYRVGFGSPTYFNSSFNKYYGYPPGEVKFRNPAKSENEPEIQPAQQDSKTVTVKKRFFNLRTYLIASLAVILVVTFVYYNYGNSEPTKSSEDKSSNLVEHSIAVLPFKNMSGNPDNEAFCDGMTTAIISRLSKIKDIEKVISQTSVMTYKDKEKTMPEIADELKVRYILESGFQKSGDYIKINVQLIEGASDKLFWSKQYESKYDSIFKIQSQVAEMVAKQLDVNITAEERLNLQESMTNNPEAYENYILGQEIMSSWTIKGLEGSRRFFEKAIKLDSTFAEAHFMLGNTYSLMGLWLGKMTLDEADKLARPYIEKAIQLDPNNEHFLISIANGADHRWNFKKADSLFKKIENLGYDQKQNADIFYFLQGNNNNLVDFYYKILENPLINETFNLNFLKVVPYALYYQNKIDEARNLMEERLLLNPNFDAFYDHFGNVYLAMGDYEKAKDILETGLIIGGKRYVSMVVHLASVYYNLGNEEKSLELLNEAIIRAQKGEPEINVFIAHYYARLGKKDEAFKWLDIAYKKHEVDLKWLRADPNLLQLKDDPRYEVLCEKIGFLPLEQG